MNIESLELAASRVVLGLLRSGDLARVGVEALEDGCDSPSLRILAGLDASDADEAKELFDRALSELNVTVPSKQTAAMHLARETAREILSGMIGAYVGANQIWEITLRASGEDLSELDSFVYAASEWDDRPDDRAVFEEGIVAAARALLSN